MYILFALKSFKGCLFKSNKMERNSYAEKLNEVLAAEASMTPIKDNTKNGLLQTTGARLSQPLGIKRCMYARGTILNIGFNILPHTFQIQGDFVKPFFYHLFCF